MDIKNTNPGTNVPKQTADEPRGDQGRDKTWEPPQGEQGISNRSDDEETDESAAVGPPAESPDDPRH